MSVEGNKPWFACVSISGAKHGYEPRDNEGFVGGGDTAGVDWGGGCDAAGDCVGETGRGECEKESGGRLGRALRNGKNADAAARAAGEDLHDPGAPTLPTRSAG